MLGRLFRYAVPNSRLIFANADAFYQHREQDTSFYGSLVISTYPLFDRAHSWDTLHPKQIRKLASEAAQGIYNASLILLEGSARMRQEPKSLADYQPPFQSGDHPWQWILAVGRDGGFWPIHISGVDSRWMTKVPWQSLDPPYHLGRAARAWYVTFFAILALAAFHGIWWALRIVRTPANQPWPWFASFSLIASCVALVVLAWLFLPVYWRWLEGYHDLENRAYPGLAILLTALPLLPLICLLRWRMDIWRRPATVVAIVTVVQVALLSAAVASLLSAGDPSAAPDRAFVRFRAINPQSGLSPLIPLALIVIILYVCATLCLRQSLTEQDFLDPCLKAPVPVPGMGGERDGWIAAVAAAFFAIGIFLLLGTSFQGLEQPAFDRLMLAGNLLAWFSLIYAAARALLGWYSLKTMLEKLEKT
jgi:hypothetical protein